jgi:hypothetical protein
MLGQLKNINEEKQGLNNLICADKHDAQLMHISSYYGHNVFMCSKHEMLYHSGRNSLC